MDDFRKYGTFIETCFANTEYTKENLVSLLIAVLADKVPHMDMNRVFTMNMLAKQFGKQDPYRNLVEFLKVSDKVITLFNSINRPYLWETWMAYHIEEDPSPEVKFLRGMEQLATALMALDKKKSKDIVIKLESFCETSGILMELI